MENEFYVGYDAMPKLGRVKTGNTPKPPKINLSGLKSDSEVWRSLPEILII